MVPLFGTALVFLEVAVAILGATPPFAEQNT